MTDDQDARLEEAAPREWWIVETEHAYFIYEDAETAKKEAVSQEEAYGYAEVHHTKSDYDKLKAVQDDLLNEIKIMQAGIDNWGKMYAEAVSWGNKLKDDEAKRVAGLVEALKFECGNRCAEQNPCNAKAALRAYERGDT